MLNQSPSDTSEIKGTVSSTTIPYDYLVFAVGAEVQTFGIPGVKDKACFMKELADAERVRACSLGLHKHLIFITQMQRRVMDCQCI